MNLHHENKEYFGDSLASKIKHVDINTIVYSSLTRDGTRSVKVVSSIGSSNNRNYLYQKVSEIPVPFVNIFREIQKIQFGKPFKFLALY